MLVAGTVAIDVVAQTEALPQPNESVVASRMDERFGGCAGNVARALARLGHAPHLVSAVGPDFAGSAYEKALLDEGVQLDDL
ncbi:MAG: PfkB family carbohydrate kinase, partial [Candidatus Thermoplasmatota archaeon]|nr:PfkB family carbohydrate kinase [Candidatus Thermoplasmatota archaeon]